MIPAKEHAVKILELLSHGLVRGLGKPIPGKMCVEAAVNFALGLPHGDEPPCVGSEVRKFKIQLNDELWSSEIARADGMERLAIAQLGSNILDQKQFRDELWLSFGQRISPLVFRYYATKNEDRKVALLEQATKMENVKTLEEAFKTQKELAHDYGYGYAHGYAFGYAHGYGYGYGYAHGYGSDVWFGKVAEVAVQVLIKLKSPGCKWLDLCETPTKAQPAGHHNEHNRRSNQRPTCG